jgi:hypothetical protein
VGCLFIGLGHDDGDGVGSRAFSGGVGGGHDDFPLAGREVVFFVAGLTYAVKLERRFLCPSSPKSKRLKL